MLKKILKILLVFVSSIIVFALGFVIVLQLFEYTPETLTPLEIQNNLDLSDENLVQLDQSIHILSFNTGYASLSATEDFVMDGGVKGRMDSQTEVEANIAGIIGIIQEQNPDIILLQEVDEKSDRSYDTLQLTSYENALQMPVTLGYNYRVLFVPFPFQFGQMMGNVNSGIASFINYNVEEATRIQLPGSFSWPLRLANLKRCVVVSRLPILNSDKYLIVINVHLSAYDDGTMRLQEMDALKQLMTDETDLGNYVIVGGDFNQTFPDAVTTSTMTINGTSTEVNNYHYALKNPSLWQAFPMEKDWFIENHFQFGVDITTPTCRLLNQPYDSLNLDNNQYYVIDGFIVSNNIIIESIETLNQNFVYSDHNPVSIQIKLNP
jgi:endonuclease/exonuclease/phosphatase family metal-dependent hydrolase